MKLSRLAMPAAQPSIDDRIMPLINIVFLLLIFFLVAGMLREPDALDVIPPESAAEAANLPEALSLYVGADGTLALGGDVVPEDELEVRLADLLSDDPERLIRIVADRGADTLAVIDLMETLRSAGAARVKLATRYVGDPL